jgi:uncharacterized protein
MFAGELEESILPKTADTLTLQSVFAGELEESILPKTARFLTHRCQEHELNISHAVQHTLETTMNNAITWFEIPTQDLNRAAGFYAQVVGTQLRRETMGPHEMAIFPYTAPAGVGGCLIATETFTPSTEGSLVYLHVGKDLDAALARTAKAGGKVALGKTALPGDLGHFAHIIDSEGNRVGLHAA